MTRVAFLTIGLLHGTDEDPRIQGFLERIDLNLAVAAGSEGFIGRSVADEETGEHSWGPWVTPAIFRKEEYLNRRPQTLSLWNDLEPVFAYAYSGGHAEALSQRKAWFVKPTWPSYVAWWVDDDHVPTWEEACARYDELYDVGPTPEAFTFTEAFGPDGIPLVVDREEVRRKVARQGRAR